jgi:NitT/TauT family transport system ATP-binding protein
MTVLEACGVDLGYGPPGKARTPVLRDFSLRVAAGEVVAVLGASGAGKSSLLRLLAGLQVPDRGTVSVHGEPLRGPHARVGFVFQDPCLLPWLTLEENVGFGLDFRSQPALGAAHTARRIRDAISEVGLLRARDRRPSELSGGMAQRAALARTLARQPEILLLDEPFSALDEVTRGEMQALLAELIARHRSAAVLVTHDIDEALRLAERIVLIGGAPARAIAEWRIAPPRPRDETLPELTRARVEIVQALRAARRLAPSSPLPA